MERTVPLSLFNEYFIGMNRPLYDDLAKWLFMPGMGFGESIRWWADDSKPLRSAPHEGVDFRCYENKSGRLQNISESSLVPAMYPGEIVGQCDDFLGETLVVAHVFLNSHGQRLCSLYGHLDTESIHHGPGIKNGEPVGRIARERASGQVPPHLHLSLAWMSDGMLSAGISWDSLAHNKDVVWLNPLDLMMEEGHCLRKC